MKGFLLFLALLGGGVAWSYTQYLSPGARHQRAASAFLAHVHMDELVRSAMLAAYREEFENRKISAKERDCMQDMTVGQFNKTLSRLLQRKLPRHDIEIAADFYRTPAGEKFSSMIMYAIASEIPSLGMQPAAEEPSLFMEDLLMVDAFRKSLKSGKKEDPLQLSFDLIMEPEMVELERDQRRKCLPASRA